MKYKKTITIGSGVFLVVFAWLIYKTVRSFTVNAEFEKFKVESKDKNDKLNQDLKAKESEWEKERSLYEKDSRVKLKTIEEKNKIILRAQKQLNQAGTMNKEEIVSLRRNNSTWKHKYNIIEDEHFTLIMNHEVCILTLSKSIESGKSTMKLYKKCNLQSKKDKSFIQKQKETIKKKDKALTECWDFPRPKFKIKIKPHINIVSYNPINNRWTFGGLGLAITY